MLSFVRKTGSNGGRVMKESLIILGTGNATVTKCYNKRINQIMVLLEKSGHVLYDMYHRTRKTTLTSNTVSV